MKIGVCGGFDRIAITAACGYDYIETNFKDLAKSSEEDFQKFLTALKDNNLACEAANCFLPGELKVTGENIDYEALKEFNSQYEGETSPDEEIALAYQELLSENPGYEDLVLTLPKKMFSGKAKASTRGMFFCYELPTMLSDGTWSNGNGLYRWYLLDTENGLIKDRVYDIWNEIKCSKPEHRVLSSTEETFAASRKSVEAFIKKTYMRSVQAPIGVRPRLVTWMELS